MATLTEYQASQLARAAADIAGYLALADLRLYQAAIDVTPTTPLATFTAAEATYTGYATQDLVWDAPSVADDGTVESVAATLTFRPSDGVTPNTIWGCFIVEAAGTPLLFAGQFDGAPLDMGSALNQIVLTVRYRVATQSVVVTIS